MVTAYERLYRSLVGDRSDRVARLGHDGRDGNDGRDWRDGRDVHDGSRPHPAIRPLVGIRVEGGSTRSGTR
jgi:hypothetical protein